MSDDIDILQQIENVDLGKVETSYPLLKTGLCRLTIKSMEFKRIESKKGALQAWCLLEFVTAQQWETVAHDGLPVKPIAPGFPLKKRVYMEPSKDKTTGEDVNYGIKDLALLRECIYGKAPEGTRLQVSDFLGQEVIGKLKFDPAPKNKDTGETFGPRTEVDGYVRKPKTA